MFTCTRKRELGASFKRVLFFRVTVVSLLAMRVSGCGSVDLAELPPESLAANVTPSRPDRNNQALQPASITQRAISFTIATAFCCDSRSMVFQAHVEGANNPNGIVYRWEFGDGRNASGSRVEHVYIWPGDYVVVLRADFPDRTVVSTEKLVSLSASPVLSSDAQAPSDPVIELPSLEQPDIAATRVVAIVGTDREAVPGAWVVLAVQRKVAIQTRADSIHVDAAS